MDMQGIKPHPLPGTHIMWHTNVQKTSLVPTQPGGVYMWKWSTVCPMSSQAASGDLLAVKDAHIAALQTELRGKRILKAKTKVGAGLC